MERSRTARPTASTPAASLNAPVPELSIPASFNATRGPRCDARTVLRCLIVDDNASFLDAATNLLEREGLDVVGVASTADGALQQVEELRPDLVLLDIVLGTESGFDVSRRLSEAYPEMTIILVSTHAEADFADLIAEAPVAGFVPKSDLSSAAILKLAIEPRGT
jgi:DNA-binding NarL/FixJ family response regulator